MSKPKSILFQLKFVDLLNKPFPNLYHEIRETGKLISANRSDAQGLGTWISRPPDTILVVHVRHPLTKKMIVVNSYIRVPPKKGTIKLKASFSIQTVKLRALDKNSGSYQRSTHQVTATKGEHEVKKGQDLYTIAKMYDTTWQILAQLNKATIKDPNRIVPGQIIKVPPKGSNLTGKTNERPDSLKDQTNYKVKKGETLSGISQRSGVSVEQLKRINGITDPTKLQSDQTIKLRDDGSVQSHNPPKPSPKPTARPRSTTTPNASNEEDGFFDNAKDAISNAAKGTVGVIGGAADWVGGKAKEGFEGVTDAMSGSKNDKPAGKAPAITPNSSSNPSSTSGNYTVKSGDTLSGIAQKHGVNTNDLARANGLKLTDTIRPGDKLKIPKGGSSGSSTGNSTQSSRADSPVNVTTKPSNSSDGTPKDVATTNGSCVCKAHDLIWGKKFNCDERLKVIEICQKLWPNNYLETANNLMAVFAWESGEKFETGAPNQKNSGGTGLIQIVPDTYKDLTGKDPIFENVHNYWGHGKTLRRIKQLADMTVLEYLDIVEKYFKPIKNKDLEFIDFYLQVLFPASSGLPEHVVFAKSYGDLDLPNENTDRKQLRVDKFSNNNMDKNGDDIVMKSEIEQSINHFLTDGEDFRLFGNCEKFSVVEKPVSKNSNCPSNINGCFCNRTKRLPMQAGFLTHSRIKKHHTPKLERKDFSQKMKYIVLHRTVNGSAKSTFSSFNTSPYYGTHFVVGKDGTIYQTANLNKRTVHAGNVNPYSVGIEVVGWPLAKDGKPTLGTKERPVHTWEKLTIEQIQSVACLAKYLLNHYALTKSALQVHEDVAAKTEGEGRTVYEAIKSYF